MITFCHVYCFKTLLNLAGIVSAGLSLPLLATSATFAATSSASFNPVLQVDGSTGSTGLTISGFGAPVKKVTTTINLTKCDDPIDSATGQCIGGGYSFNDEVGLGLQSPSGTYITLLPFGTLSGQVPGATATFTFSDFATSGLGGSTLISGTYLPSSPLSTFTGEAGDGVWTLFFADQYGADPLSVNSWSLTVETVPGPLPVLGAAAAFGYSRRIRRRIAVSRPQF